MESPQHLRERVVSVGPYSSCWYVGWEGTLARPDIFDREVNSGYWGRVLICVRRHRGILPAVVVGDTSKRSNRRFRDGLCNPVGGCRTNAFRLLILIRIFARTSSAQRQPVLSVSYSPGNKNIPPFSGPHQLGRRSSSPPTATMFLEAVRNLPSRAGPETQPGMDPDTRHPSLSRSLHRRTGIGSESTSTLAPTDAVGSHSGCIDQTSRNQST